MAKFRFPSFKLWSNLEYAFHIVVILLILFGIGGIIDAVKGIMMLKQKPFILEMRDEKPGVVSVQQLSITSNWVQGFTKDYITIYGNWDYNNYNERMEQLRRYTDPKYISIIEEQVKKVEKDILENKLVNKFKINEQNVGRSGENYIIEIGGVNTMQGSGVGGESVDIKYKLTVREVKCTADNPWALELIHLEEIPL